MYHSATASAVVTSKERRNSNAGQSHQGRTVQNFLLVWLDANNTQVDSDDYLNSMTKLRQIVNKVDTFTDSDECVRYIDSIKDENAFIIFSGSLGKTTVPIIHNKPQVSAIYIFCANEQRHRKWAKKWLKIRGVFTDITLICEAIKLAAQESDQNSVSISFVKSSYETSDGNLDQLDPSFMYTQILKEILLTIDFEQHHFNEYLMYCDEQFIGNTVELDNIEKLRTEYYCYPPIWWFTYDCFLYSMLNKALRTMEVDLIIKMGFFIRDLHKNIATLHSEQHAGRQSLKSFTVYRGQGLSQTDFAELKKAQGGLLSFNNFLSTSRKRSVSLEFAERTIENSDLVGIVFVMKIYPSIDSTPFADVHSISDFESEEEILFSMHSVFRIGHITQIDETDRLWEVKLKLTSDNDPQLHALAKSIRKDTSSDYKGWDQLGMLLIKLSHFEKAEELYEILLHQTSTPSERAYVHHQLGRVKNYCGKYDDAIENYEKSIEISQGIPSTDPCDLATTYNNIGLVYQKKNQYDKALSYHEKDLRIKEATLPSNDLNLATPYNNMGSVYNKLGDYPKALLYHEKALAIRREKLSSNDPEIATSYHNIGSVLKKMGEYSRALESHEKALAIRKKALPLYHPDFGTSYTNIGSVYFEMEEYSKALPYFEKAVDIGRHSSLSADHPRRQQWKNNLKRVRDAL